MGGYCSATAVLPGAGSPPSRFVVEATMAFVGNEATMGLSLWSAAARMTVKHEPARSTHLQGWLLCLQLPDPTGLTVL